MVVFSLYVPKFIVRYFHDGINFHLTQNNLGQKITIEPPDIHLHNVSQPIFYKRRLFL